MKTSEARAEWHGPLKDGQGVMTLASGKFDGAYSFTSRFEAGAGTNPEELIAAAHAGCFSMALAHGLSSAGFEPKRIATIARVTIGKDEGGFAITDIALSTEGAVPGIDDETFRQQAETAKHGCPVSKALAGGPRISLTDMKLAGG
ncbi:MAG: OsmC family peroxiredoxin [Alphaproteobacteria bacterium]|jgi:osmotically inducible protein OsmC|nr:OsmC family peroxiredoxin [Alphaproteobacteria bacterium]